MANLIAYYSRKGENYWNGGIRNIAKGNTERVAEFIQNAVGGDLFEIDTVKPYPADYYECIDVAKDELHADARPEIRGYVDDASWGKYDTIYLGYPNWWGNVPMCILTFLDHYNQAGALAGKTIACFCTNEGSGLGSSVRQLQKHYPDAHFVDGLSIHGAEAAQSERVAAAWAKKVK